MDWDYFRHPEHGRFKLRRLPTVKTPAKVIDLTEIADHSPDFRGLDMEEGISHYQRLFDDKLSYDVEIEEIADAFKRAKKAKLGDLAVFKGDYSLVEHCIEYLMQPEQDLDELPEFPESVVPKALKAGYITQHRPVSEEEWAAGLDIWKMTALKELADKAGIERSKRKDDMAQALAKAGMEGNSDIPFPPVYEPTHKVIDDLEVWIDGLVGELHETLKDYPKHYQAAVWDEIQLDWEPAALVHEAMYKHLSDSLNIRWRD